MPQYNQLTDVNYYRRISEEQARARRAAARTACLTACLLLRDRAKAQKILEDLKVANGGVSELRVNLVALSQVEGVRLPAEICRHIGSFLNLKTQ